MKKILPILLLWLTGIVLPFIVLWLVLQLVSCTTTKDNRKSKTSTSSSTRTEDSLRIQQLRSDSIEFERQIKELTYGEAVFTGCPEIDTMALVNAYHIWKPGVSGRSPLTDTSLWFRKFRDSLVKAVYKKPAPSKFKMDKDGNTEIEGVLASVRWGKARAESQVLKYQSLVKTLIENQIKMATDTSSLITVKDSHRKRSFMGSFWIWVLIGVVLGAVGMWRLIRWMDGFKDAKHFSTNQ